MPSVQIFLPRSLSRIWKLSYSQFQPKDFGTDVMFHADHTIDYVYSETLTKLKPSLDGAKLPTLIFVNKGVEIGTQALTLEIIADTCGQGMAKAAAFLVRAIGSVVEI